MEDAMSEPDPNEPAGAPQEQLGESGLKALSAERDARKEAERQIKELKDQLKELKPAADRLKEIEDQQKSDLEKANERMAELERKAAHSATEALRFRIATKHGISDEDADVFLTGSDEESITKQAERLVALQGEKVVAQQQKPDPSQGARPSMPKDAWSRGSARAKQRYGTPGN
jgi:predicted nuclease with TOPRIM domain